MIKPSEIRIGGYVYYNNQVLQIESYCNGKVNVYAGYYGDTPHVHGISCGDLEPISLTPEWLARCGFRKDMGGGGGLLEFDNGFICFYDMSEPLVGYSGITDELINGGLMPNLKYVHQLQNLFFTLTGEEIEFKLP
jgi:hypothetical protein